jgi:prepilin peptidase CpaA
MSETYVTILTAGYVGYVILFTIAALSDIVRFTIPNAVVLALAALFCAISIVVPIGTDWLGHVGSLGLMLAIGVPAYRFRVLGAGDVKLIAAGALWVGWEQLPTYVTYVAIAGAVLGLGLMVARSATASLLSHHPRGSAVALPRLLVWGEGIPYGVAIAAGSVVIAGDLPHLGLLL